MVGAFTLALGVAAHYTTGHLNEPRRSLAPPHAAVERPVPVAEPDPEPDPEIVSAAIVAPVADGVLPMPTAPEPMPAVATNTAPVPAASGSLFVESRPAGAVVYFNERRVGKTPLVVSDLRAGQGVVRLERDGYRRWSSVVDVTAGRRTRVAASLEGQGAGTR